MSEVTDLLQQKAGLSPEQAQLVETLVASHLVSKVPPQFQGILSSFIGPATPVEPAAPAAGGGLGSLLGEAESLFGSRG